ncbi:hypothetical protein GGR55DRAFT_326000 [Xylaria sp. FL0064]|nr:hypothetical protein GGR55DRAFT_326000 [Xylaria sp. FL0064]
MNPAAIPRSSRGHVVIIAGAVTNGLATLAVCARIYTRHVIKRSVGIDDWMAVMSLFLTIGMNISQSVNATRYLGRHTYDLDPSVDIPRFLQLFWINELFYNADMFFIKMTFLSQYYRVFRHVRALRIIYLVAIFVIGGWCLGQFLSVVFLCVPVKGLWDKSVKAKCQDQLVGVYLNAVGTLVTDFVILFLPMPAIWKLNLPKAQKWALMGIFSLGIFTSAISIIRLTTLGDPGEDLTYHAITSSCWSVAELSSGIIAAALATIRPLIGRFMPFASKLNSAPEDEGLSLGPLERTVSQRSSRYCYYESSSRDSEADLGLWPGTQTKVTGGLPPLPQLSAKESKGIKPQGLTIRMDRDWEVQETYIETQQTATI